MKKLLLALAMMAFATTAHAQTETTTTETTVTKSIVNTATPDKLILDTTKGKIVIALRPDLAPEHVARVKQLASEGFYDGVVFHRVVDGFMAQTGDPTGTGMGGSKYPDLKAEFTSTPYVRGTVGAARSQSPDSANSQFFITFNGDAGPSLNGKYTVWGQVIEGMDAVDGLKKGPDGVPITDPDKIIKATIESATGAAPTATIVPAVPVVTEQKTETTTTTTTTP